MKHIDIKDLSPEEATVINELKQISEGRSFGDTIKLNEITGTLKVPTD